MVYLGFEPGAAGWKAQTDPLSYGGAPTSPLFCATYRMDLNFRRRRSETKLKWKENYFWLINLVALMQGNDKFSHPDENELFKPEVSSIL